MMSDPRDHERAPDRRAGDDELDARLAEMARVLRAPESLSAGFDARLLGAVRAGPHPVRRAASDVLRLSPRRALAAAAAIAAVAFLGGLVAGRGASPGSARTAVVPATSVASAAEGDTVHVVRFLFIAPAARSVAIVGDFNGWSRTATPLAPTGAGGAWSATVALPVGQHQYAFIVNDSTWTTDPSTPLTVHDDFGTTSSIVSVGSGAS